MIVAHNDLDGVVSAAFLRMRYPDENSLFFISYDRGRFEILRDIILDKDERRFVLLDIAIRSEEIPVLKQILSSTDYSLYVDHHKDSCYEQLSFSETVHDTTKAACELAFNLLGDNQKTGLTRWWAEIGRDRDLAINEHLETGRALDFLARNNGRKLADYILAGKTPLEVIELERETIDRSTRMFIRAKLLYELTRYEEEINGIRWVIGLTTGYATDISYDILSSSTEDKVLIFLMPKDYTRTGYRLIVSLRSNRLDISRIAKSLGGGGHPLAAGCSIEIERDSATLPAILRLLHRESCRV